MTQFADFHPETKLCTRADGVDRTIHVRTLGDCLADLAEAVTTLDVTPATEAANFRRCLADAKRDGMDVRHHIVCHPVFNRWVLTLRVCTAGSRWRVAKAQMNLTFDQFCVIERVFAQNKVPEARNA